MKRCLWGCALLALSLMTAAAGAAAPDEIILQSTAGSHGLVRGWFTQAEIDSSRARIAALTLDSGTLFVQSDRAMLCAFDAETGSALWNTVRQVGNPNYPTYTPSFNENLLAVVNGPHIYLLNRYTGDGLWDRDLPGAAVAGPTLSDQRVYVPLVNGQIISYRIKPAIDPLKDLHADKGKKGDSKPDHAAKAAKAPKADASAAGDKDAGDKSDASAKPDTAKAPSAADKSAVADLLASDLPVTVTRENYKVSQDYVTPLMIQSLGGVASRLVVTRQTDEEESLVWPTEEGLVLVCSVDRRQQNAFNIKYRVDMGSPVKTPLVYMPYRSSSPDYGLICTTAYNGLVAALDEKTGESMWQFSTNEPIAESAAMVGDNVFVLTQLGNMFCLDIKNGAPRWSAAHVSQFLAVTRDRAYVSDRSGSMVRILNNVNGVTLGIMPVGPQPVRLSNAANDRLYLASKTGLIQCLHEEGLVKPLVYTVPRKKAEKVVKKVVERPKSDEDKPKPPPKERKPAAPRKPVAKPDAGDAPEKPAPKPRVSRRKAKADAAAGGDANPFGATPAPKN